MSVLAEPTRACPAAPPHACPAALEPPRSLTALAALAAQHGAPGGVVRRMGRVRSATPDMVTVDALAPWLAPGARVLIGAGDGHADRPSVFGLVRELDDARARIALDRTGPRPGDWAEAASEPHGPTDAGRLGCTLDARGRPLSVRPARECDDCAASRGHAFDRDGPPVRTDAERAAPALRTGDTTIDALFPPRRGERWLVSGPPGSGRSTLLRSIVGACALPTVLCALGHRARDGADDAGHLLRIATGPAAGPAECLEALARAIAAARALHDAHGAALVLIDGAERLPPSAPIAAMLAGLSAVATVREGCAARSDGFDHANGFDRANGFDGEIVLAGPVGAGSRFPAVAIARTLERGAPVADREIAALLRAVPARGMGALADRLHTLAERSDDAGPERAAVLRALGAAEGNGAGS